MLLDRMKADGFQFASIKALSGAGQVGDLKATRISITQIIVWSICVNTVIVTSKKKTPTNIKVMDP